MARLQPEWLDWYGERGVKREGGRGVEKGMEDELGGGRGARKEKEEVKQLETFYQESLLTETSWISSVV